MSSEGPFLAHLSSPRLCPTPREVCPCASSPPSPSQAASVAQPRRRPPRRPLLPWHLRCWTLALGCPQARRPRPRFHGPRIAWPPAASRRQALVHQRADSDISHGGRLQPLAGWQRRSPRYLQAAKERSQKCPVSPGPRAHRLHWATTQSISNQAETGVVAAAQTPILELGAHVPLR
jgi:hypothetical protein